MAHRFEALTAAERLIAVAADCGRHPQFALFAPTMMIGTAHIRNDIPTAATDGEDEFYNEEFILNMTRAQLRYLRLHEAAHKILHHCAPMYKTYRDKYPTECNKAMDYVINMWIENMDPAFAFVARPTEVKPLIDVKYKGWAWLRILQDLLRKQPPPPPEGDSPDGQPGGEGNCPDGQPGDGQPGDGDEPFDQHLDSPRDEAQEAELKQKVEDAAVQGKMLSDRLAAKAGNGQGGGKLPTDALASTTRWQDALLEFMQAVQAGDEFSRYNPPNRRLQPLGILMPTHFAEAMPELILAVDTSGSMYHLLPQVLGEVARICAVARPEKVRILWWDTEVHGEQVFTPDRYADIAKAMHPAGGGGTVPSCVTAYLARQRIEAAAVVWLTDGDFYTAPAALPKVPQIWGVIGSYPFTAATGKVLRIPAL